MGQKKKPASTTSKKVKGTHISMLIAHPKMSSDKYTDLLFEAMDKIKGTKMIIAASKPQKVEKDGKSN